MKNDCFEFDNINDFKNVVENSAFHETDFHPLNPQKRQLNPQHASMVPVHISNNVFNWMKFLILKGATIGEGTVIGAGSVVSTDIPASVIAAGTPAKVISKIDTKSN